MSPESLKFLRIMIAVQVLIAAWFVFSPDILPSIIKEAERQNDQPIYETLDNIIVPLVHIQTLLCIALWWPSKIASWCYILVIAAITALSAFAGPGIVSAIDSILSYMQVLASGALLCILYLNKLFSWSSGDR